MRHYDVRRMLAGIRKELDSRCCGTGGYGANCCCCSERGRLNQLTGQLEALSPLAILDRGYALVFDSSGMLLKDAARVKAGDEISARLAKGSLTATVKRGRQKKFSIWFPFPFGVRPVELCSTRQPRAAVSTWPGS